ncbi:SH3 domain-containing protein [Hyalangium versicolor]|uniref:SH3 domain-containing protein n=1 Tax=Hyalangium versicolor TaxID=2861190 RepID=UPI001CCF3B0C|nr:SH3 domain-containing protein [Hyalangium versicolor]
MHKRARWLMATLALCAASAALAVEVNGTLYVKARNTRLMAAPPPSTTVKAVLQPGQQVKWLGADAKDKQWHRVEVDGKTAGVVFQSNLSTKPPNMELTTKNGTPSADMKALASSGAAVRGLSEGAIAYGKEKGAKTPGFSQAVDQLEALEKLADDIKPQDLSKHAQEAHLFPVVGPRDTTAKRGAK